MSIYKPKFTDPKTGKLRKSRTYWLNFRIAGQRYRETTGTARYELAGEIEKRRRTEIEAGLNGLPTSRSVKKDRLKHFADVADDFTDDYAVRHPASAKTVEHKLRHAKAHLGKLPMIEIGEQVITEYQTERLKEKGAPKSINEEVALILRLLGDRGEAIRIKLRRNKVLKLKVAQTPGKVFSGSDQDGMLAVALDSTLAARADMARRRRGEKTPKGARQGGSPNIYPALVLALNAGMRDAEIRNLTWAQVDFEKRFLTVGKSKTEAGEGRTIPLNGAILSALAEHRSWYVLAFGQPLPAWFVFPGGARVPTDPAKPITTLRTAWRTVRRDAKVSGRWHDNRHTLITELAESGAGDGTIMEIAGHVSLQMLARYSHIRMTAKRNALDDVQKRREDAHKKAQNGAQATLLTTVEGQLKPKSVSKPN
jgi:integrase